MADVMDQAEFQSLVLERLDQNSEFQERVLSRFDQMEQEQQKVLARLEIVEEEQKAINGRLTEFGQEQKAMNIRLEAFQKGSEGVVGMAKTIIITAGASVIFAPLLRELAPAIASLFNTAPTT